MLINGNRALIVTLFGCMSIIIILIGRLYMKQQKRAMKGQARYDILSEFSDTVLFEYDCLDKTLVFTPNITTLFGLKEIGQIRPFENDTDFAMVHPDDVEKVKNLLSTIGDKKDEIDDFVIRFKDKNGNYRWVRWMGRLVRGRLGTPQVFLGKISDVQDEMTKEQDLLEKASIDGLTGALNRKSAEAKIGELMQNKNCKGYLFMIDIDDFKTVNDTMGHAFGDEVLRNLAVRLQSMFRATDIVGRTGGDEFMVFLKDIRDITMIEREGKKIEQFFHQFEVGEYVKYSVTASVGAAVFPGDGKSFEELYKAADNALYVSKRHGKNQLSFYKKPENETK